MEAIHFFYSVHVSVGTNCIGIFYFFYFYKLISFGRLQKIPKIVTTHISEDIKRYDLVAERSKIYFPYFFLYVITHIYRVSVLRLVSAAVWSLKENLEAKCVCVQNTQGHDKHLG